MRNEEALNHPLEQDFTVFNEDGTEIGDIHIESIGDIPTFQEMPKELEINGFVYHIEV